MCIVDKEFYLAPEDLTVWKVVRANGYGGFVSQYAPENRTPVSEFCLGDGQCLVYGKGDIVRSPAGPGIMAYVNRDPSLPQSIFCVLIELRIPKGTVCRNGWDDTGAKDRRIICAQQVEVIG